MHTIDLRGYYCDPRWCFEPFYLNSAPCSCHFISANDVQYFNFRLFSLCIYIVYFKAIERRNSAVVTEVFKKVSACGNIEIRVHKSDKGGTLRIASIFHSECTGMYIFNSE
jgi:hypothetical protein